MYAGSLTQQASSTTFSRPKTCKLNLFFTFWIRFWCNCFRREQFSSLKFGSNFYNQSLISACFPCKFLFEFEQKISFKIAHADCNYTKTKVKKSKIDYMFFLAENLVALGYWVNDPAYI